MTHSQTHARRQFLKFLAASPLLAAPALASPLRTLLDPQEPAPAPGSTLWSEKSDFHGDVITSPEQALDVMEFEAAAKKALPPAHFGYLATGVDDDATVIANHEGYGRLQLRARRLTGVEKPDTSVKIFGNTWETPITIQPVSALKAFHPEGEVAVGRAARAKGHLQMLSTVATSSVEEVTAARGAPIWQQLYTTNVWEITRAIITRAERAGCPAIVLTVDLHENSNRETLFKSRRYDDRDCTLCHGKGFASYVSRKPMFDGLDVSKVTGLHFSGMTWDFVKRLRDTTTKKLLIKGIVTKEDAQLAVEHGVDGLVVSNHGGRAEETLRPTIECLPEVVEGVRGKVPVLIDGGVRRGTDIFKALALGATAVGIGRPYAWGLAAFGQAGVEAVLAILRRELETVMRQVGARSIGDINRGYVVERR
jgi:(S)-2-hydroxy-acid oxidase